MEHAEPSSSTVAAYREPLYFTLLQQLLTGFLCALDSHGSLVRVFGCAFMSYWIGAGWLLVRRFSSPTRTDILYLRWSFFPILVLSFVFMVSWVRLFDS